MDDAAARKRRGAHAPKAVAAVTRADGPLGLAQVVRVRLRYFTESVALGSEAWVEEVFERNRKILKVEQERGARVLKAPGLKDLRGMVDLVWTADGNNQTSKAGEREGSLRDCVREWARIPGRWGAGHAR